MLCIQMNSPAHTNPLCSNLKWLVVMRNFFEQKEKIKILGHTAFFLGLFSVDFSLHVTCILH